MEDSSRLVSLSAKKKKIDPVFGAQLNDEFPCSIYSCIGYTANMQKSNLSRQRKN